MPAKAFMYCVSRLLVNCNRTTGREPNPAVALARKQGKGESVITPLRCARAFRYSHLSSSRFSEHKVNIVYHIAALLSPLDSFFQPLILHRLSSSAITTIVPSEPPPQNQNMQTNPSENRFTATHPTTEPFIFARTNPASPLHYPKSQTALLLLDMQTFAVPNGPTGRAALDVISELEFWCETQEIMTLHCGTAITLHCQPFLKDAARIRDIQNFLEIVPQHPGGRVKAAPASTKLAPDLDYYLRQPGRSSALTVSHLRARLEDNNIRSLLLCGFSTSGSVLSTALAAADAGYRVTVVNDACADPMLGLHENLVAFVLPTQTNVVNAEVLMRELGKDLEQKPWEITLA